MDENERPERPDESASAEEIHEYFVAYESWLDSEMVRIISEDDGASDG